MKVLFKKTNGFILLNTDGIVSSIDTGMNASTASFNISQSLDEVHSFKILPNGHSIMLGKKNNITTLQIFDNTFTPIHSRDFASSHAFISNFDIGNQQVFVGGCAFSHKTDVLAHQFNDYNGDAFRGFSNSFIKTFDLNLQSNDEIIDAEFLDLVYDSVIYTLDDCYYSGSNMYRSSYLNPKVVIKNNGTVPIDSISIHFSQPQSCLPFYQCINYYETEKVIDVGGLNILPGNTESVNIPYIFYELEGILNSNQEVFIKLVNDKLDDNFSSNLYILQLNHPGDVPPIDDTTTVVDPIDTSNTNHPSNPIRLLKIYPNPAQNFITVETIDEINDVESFDYDIYNSIGQVVQSEQNVSIGHKLNIDIRKLQTGYYILKARTNTGIELIQSLIKN